MNRRRAYVSPTIWISRHQHYFCSSQRREKRAFSLSVASVDNERAGCWEAKSDNIRWNSTKSGSSSSVWRIKRGNSSLLSCRSSSSRHFEVSARPSRHECDAPIDPPPICAEVGHDSPNQGPGALTKGCCLRLSVTKKKKRLLVRLGPDIGEWGGR